MVGEDGLSTKEEKAYQLIEQGKNIKIVKEEEFVKLLNGEYSKHLLMILSYFLSLFDIFYHSKNKFKNTISSNLNVKSYILRNFFINNRIFLYFLSPVYRHVFLFLL